MPPPASPDPSRAQSGGGYLTPLNLMLLAVPAAVALKLAGVGGTWLFIGSAVGIVPLAGLIGKATEALAARAGAGVGALLNATFGNAAELIIALIILWRGPELYPVVRATITGSIIGNLLLILGISMVVGGWRFRKQKFNETGVGVGTTVMAIAAAGLLIPTLFYYLPEAPEGPADTTRRVNYLSEEIAVVLMAVYGFYLWFSLRTHSDLFRGEERESDAREAHWSVATAIGALLAATVAVAFLSEWLVGAIEPAAHSLGMNGIFVGVVVVAIVGNAAEHFSAVMMAWEDRMDVAVQIAVGSSTQIALFVAPALVFASLFMGHSQPLDLHFTPLEVAAITLSVGLVALVSHDGQSNWLEGAMLIALYLILSLAFYNLPMGADSPAPEAETTLLTRPLCAPRFC